MDKRDLKKQLQDILDHDPSLSRYGLQASVHENLVVLQGIVDVLADKRYAETTIRSVPGVTAVENDLVISTDGGIDDEDVNFEVGEELRADPVVPDSIGSEVHSGRVRLVGSSENRIQVEAAIKDAEKARGVVDVNSDVRIENESKDDRERIDYRMVEIHPHDQVVVDFFDRIGADPFLNEAGLNCYWEREQLVIDGIVESVDAKKSLEHTVQDMIRQAPRRFMVENRVCVES